MQSRIDIGTVKRVHFIGIGGIGMSALARLLLHEKKQVSGSDRSSSEVTLGLEALGISVSYSQVEENITDDIELVVYSDGVPKDNLERVAAERKKIASLSYFEALGSIANQYHLIAIAGTHGKTTTTAMSIDLLEDAGLDPTAVVGSLRAKTKSNFRAGKGKYFVVEADEYMRHFLAFTPDILVITNIDADHLDYYKDISDIQSAFRTLISQVREGGVVITNPKDPSIGPVLGDTKAEVIDYTKYVDLLLPMKVFGMHNRLNGGVALALASALGIDLVLAKQSLSNFRGTWRRFEYKGEMENGALVYEDYAHHPTEIIATIKGAREAAPNKKIIAIFQPHLYSRTKKLFTEFARALASADAVIVAEIYAAREENDPTITSNMLAREIAKSNSHAAYLSTLEEIAAHVKKIETKDDLILILGAGDIHSLPEKLTNT